MDLMVNPVITGFRQEVDGTIKELKLGEAKQDAYANIIEQGGSAKLDNNKTVTITENGIVEITPTAGKDGMKKVTATVNVANESTPFYAWASGENNYYYTLKETPSAGDKVYGMGYAVGDISPENPGTVTAYADDLITFSIGGGTVDAERDNTKDLVFTVS